MTPSIQSLAFLGDAVYSLRVREMLVAQNVAPAKIATLANKIVSAPVQAAAYHKIYPLLTPEEQAIIKRGRNLHSTSRAKGATITQYRHATGLEALFGFLCYNNRHERITQLFEICTQGGCQ